VAIRRSIPVFHGWIAIEYSPIRGETEPLQDQPIKTQHITGTHGQGSGSQADGNEQPNIKK
jgi:hypothetical protein